MRNVDSGFSLAEGSVEPYGSTVVTSYGVNPWIMVQDAASGSVLLSAVIGPNNSSLWRGGVSNYRVYTLSTDRFAGHPTQLPSVALEGGDVYVSWNGATHVKEWALLTGTSADAASTEVRRVGKTGFETKMSAEGSEAFVVVQGIAANGTRLGTSAVYQTSDGSVVARRGLEVRDGVVASRRARVGYP